MMKTILLFALSVSIESLGAVEIKKESESNKLNRKIVQEMRLVEQFAKDSRKMRKEFLKQRNLTGSDKENIRKMEKENQKLLEQVKESINRIEAD